MPSPAAPTLAASIPAAPRVGGGSDLRGHLRAIARAVALGATSLAAGAALLPVARSARARRVVQRAWARSAARIIGMRVRIEGPRPPRGSLVVANHLGYLDPIALWSAASGTCVAKSEVAGWPLVGSLGRLVGTVFIDRSRRRDVLRVLPAIERELRRGGRVVLFAEATSTRGDRVLPFKSSLFEAAVRTGAPIACASVHYATPAGAPTADLAVCWWGSMTFLDHVYALLRLPRVDATVRFAPAALRGGDRKALARAAHAVVCAVWKPVGESR